MTREEALASLPLRNPRVTTERGPDGGLNLTLPRGEAPWTRALALVFALPRKRTYQLDERGEWFWELCDGTRRVSELTQAVAERYELARDEALEFAVRYIGALTARGLLIVQVPRADARAQPAADETPASDETPAPETPSGAATNEQTPPQRPAK